MQPPSRKHLFWDRAGPPNPYVIGNILHATEICVARWDIWNRKTSCKLFPGESNSEKIMSHLMMETYIIQYSVWRQVQSLLYYITI